MPKVALLDAGAQLEKVIMRRVLEQGYEVDKFPADVSPSKIRDYDAIIISGGPRSVYGANSLLPNREIYNMEKPILAICYGMQLLAHQLGGTVERGVTGQYGRSQINILGDNQLFSELDREERVLMSHFDTVEKVPDGFEVLAESNGLVAAIGNEEKRMYGVQFHPELIPVTKNGNKIFENFFRYICNFPEAQKRTIEQEIEYSKKLILEIVGSDKPVMHYFSGGVDSTVMGILLTQCIEPDRLYIRTLDTGTLRLGEVEEIRKIAAELNFPNFKILDVKDRFYDTMREISTKQGKVLAGPLCFTVDPEHKRKLFGTEYAIIALTEMAHISHENNIPSENILLGQGTLRPDVIESGDERVTKGGADTIKTHHNAVEALKSIPKIEPMIELFKDQVRLAALNLDLPERFAYRQPFPGPGLYCRIVGYDGNNFKVDDKLKQLDKRVQEAAIPYGFDTQVLPIKTVGVQGDERSYKHPVIVSGDIDWKEFAKFVLALPNQEKDINRVWYSRLPFKDPFSLTKTFMTRDVIQQTQEADLIMRDVAERYGYNDSRKCSQMPGSLIPSGDGQRSFVIRPVWTHDFMAIIGMMPHKEIPFSDSEEFFPEEMFLEMAERIPNEVTGIDKVILDSSDKPPGSTELE